jgi:hypothetical protein
MLRYDDDVDVFYVISMKVWIELWFDEFWSMMRLRHDLCDLWWKNGPMKCLKFMKEICVESRIIKVNVKWFCSMKHEHGCEWKVNKRLKYQDKFSASH